MSNFPGDNRRLRMTLHQLQQSIIMTSLLKLAKSILRRAPSPTRCFPKSGFQTINASIILEEERFEQFKKGCYYPVNIGDVLGSKYQVIGKLGFGVTSTVWLARDLEYVTCWFFLNLHNTK